MIDNGHRPGPRRGEAYHPDAVGPIEGVDVLPEGVVAHLPGPWVALEVEGRRIAVRQVCAWCGEVLVDDEYDPLPALVLPGHAQPQFRSFQPGLWLALYEVDGDPRATMFAQHVRPAEACLWLEGVEHGSADASDEAS